MPIYVPYLPLSWLTFMAKTLPEAALIPVVCSYGLNGLVTYILIWPVLSAGTLLLLVVSLIRDIIHARRKGKDLL